MFISVIYPAIRGESTYCPNCKKLLVERLGYNVVENNIQDGRCKYCQEKIAGIWRNNESL